MKISVVIPALNEAAGIADAVRRAWRAGADDVVVADGGSTDGTLALAEQERCQIARSEPGRARQQNAGAQLALGSLLVFQHADNWLAEDALAQIKPALQTPAVVGGSFRQRIEAPGIVYRWIERGNAFRARWLGLPYGDQNLFVRRELFEQIGGFADVPLMEDVLLVRALRRHGRLVVLPGPLHVDARRWQRYGIARQTIRNWSLITALYCGVAPQRLAKFYPRHDAEKK